jgi:hypothetical protein
MKVKIAVAASLLLLTSCVSVPAPTPAPITGDGSPKAQVMQLNQGVREALGARNKDELIVRVGVDGTITLYGAEGQGFSVEKIREDVVTEKGVVNRVIITTVRNSPECNSVIFSGKKYWYPVPDCPHLQ